MPTPLDLRVPKPQLAESELFQTIAEALERLRFGTIQITIHDGKTMQVDVTERRRFGN